MQKVTPFLWFDGKAEEAAKFYASVFGKSKVGKSVSGPDGKVMVVPFEIEGQPFTALNGGPQFKFNESVSFVVHCKDQEEVDYYWDKLVAGGGQESMCGWLKDKYGLSWQVVPTVLAEMMSDPDKEKSGRAMEAMLQMKKLDIAELQRAFAGETAASRR
jgi:predicted 3-demethylubiquinone-9 3-methyltransferase (glyoxalase superfamily)